MGHYSELYENDKITKLPEKLIGNFKINVNERTLLKEFGKEQDKFKSFNNFLFDYLLTYTKLYLDERKMNFIGNLNLAVKEYFFDTDSYVKELIQKVHEKIFYAYLGSTVFVTLNNYNLDNCIKYMSKNPDELCFNDYLKYLFYDLFNINYLNKFDLYKFFLNNYSSQISEFEKNIRKDLDKEIDKNIELFKINNAEVIFIINNLIKDYDVKSNYSKFSSITIYDEEYRRTSIVIVLIKEVETILKASTLKHNKLSNAIINRLSEEIVCDNSYRILEIDFILKNMKK